MPFPSYSTFKVLRVTANRSLCVNVAEPATLRVQQRILPEFASFCVSIIVDLRTFYLCFLDKRGMESHEKLCFSICEIWLDSAGEWYTGTGSACIFQTTSIIVTSRSLIPDLKSARESFFRFPRAVIFGKEVISVTMFNECALLLCNTFPQALTALPLPAVNPGDPDGLSCFVLSDVLHFPPTVSEGTLTDVSDGFYQCIGVQAVAGLCGAPVFRWNADGSAAEWIGLVTARHASSGDALCAVFRDPLSPLLSCPLVFSASTACPASPAAAARTESDREFLVSGRLPVIPYSLSQGVIGDWQCMRNVASFKSPLLKSLPPVVPYSKLAKDLVSIVREMVLCQQDPARPRPSAGPKGRRYIREYKNAEGWFTGPGADFCEAEIGLVCGAYERSLRRCRLVLHAVQDGTDRPLFPVYFTDNHHGDDFALVFEAGYDGVGLTNVDVKHAYSQRLRIYPYQLVGYADVSGAFFPL